MVISPTKRKWLVVFGASAALVTAGPALAAPSLKSKRAEAKRVLAQIQQIDAELSKAVDAYNAAQIRLESIVVQRRLNRGHLRIARSNFAKAQSALAGRLLALYTSGEVTVLDVLLGSTSLDELLDRVDTVNRVSEQDARIIREIKAFQAEIRRREAQLKRAHAEQKRAVAERAARRAFIERKLAERRLLLASIKDQIAKLEAAAAARQRRLQAAARARFAQQPPQVPTGSTWETTIAATAIAAPPPARYGGVIGVAMQYLGIPYQWAGASPETGFDCSGFIMYVYAKIGVSLPHSAAAQFSYGTPVAREQLEPGDMVFFNGLSHNGIYIGAGQFIHSPHTGDVVKISSLSDPWYAATWVGGRRL